MGVEPRKRRRRRPKRRGAAIPGPKRPGSVFRKNHHLEEFRQGEPPNVRGWVDWYLFRKNINPYWAKGPRWKAYEKGFIRGRLEKPNPPFPALEWGKTAGKKTI